ncbi:MAG: hypothetical protein P1V18_04155 [Candidatus Gracilibacteria bacterium]|nr:hypothetical protein [Candidatus Gracilibacteria bacterium]
MPEDKGQPIPVIFKKKDDKVQSPAIDVNVHHKKIDRRVFTQEQIGIDKIAQDSDASFYITGKTTKIGFLNFLQLVSKHDMGQVQMKENEEIVLSSDLVMRIATADVVDSDEDDMRFIDAMAIGIFIAGFFLSCFALLSNNIADINTFAWILLTVSLLFLGHYTHRGSKSGELQRYFRVAVKSLSKK